MERWKGTGRNWSKSGTGSFPPHLFPDPPSRGSHGCLASKQADSSRPLHHQCRHRGSPADRPYALAGDEGLGQALGGRGQRPHLGGGQVGKFFTSGKNSPPPTRFGNPIPVPTLPLASLVTSFLALLFLAQKMNRVLLSIEDTMHNVLFVE